MESKRWKNHKKEECNCKQCGKIFSFSLSTKRAYCSRTCYYKSIFGRKNPNAVKAMMAITRGRKADW